MKQLFENIDRKIVNILNSKKTKLEENTKSELALIALFKQMIPSCQREERKVDILSSKSVGSLWRHNERKSHNWRHHLTNEHL